MLISHIYGSTFAPEVRAPCAPGWLTRLAPVRSARTGHVSERRFQIQDGPENVVP